MNSKSNCNCCATKEKISKDHPDLKIEELDGDNEEI